MQSLLWRAIDNWLAPTPERNRVDWLRGWQFAHRGLHGRGKVENSLSAFSAALNAGMGIECDVQTSADGRAVVFHDTNLDRLTHQRGPVSQRTIGELTRIGLGDTADNIATLHDLLKLVRGRVPILVEIKIPHSGRIERICLAVRRELEGYPGAIGVMSFDPRVSNWFSRHGKTVCRGLVVTEENARTLSGSIKRNTSFWAAKPHFLAYDVRDLPSRFAARQRRRGVPLLTWTVNSLTAQEIADTYADASIAEAEGVV
ncbi:glycerophosphodiester phosphodiesterase [Altererythrobacter indicus]|uniref:Glycerophosphodiester phosphodiesterase n=1 Tax=Altericroceibacterium indicum TaxID=374177 RepID=A0A845ABY4_9SPHN|nr:glycerophosphodiester phosphodiesterase family protein [Altericroceibacterium indicum]MXP26899.1 glycerophosphodiester phosphodiesterase [Altericroceibacterium indicum]